MKVILDSRHQGQSIFLNFMTLLDLSHDPGENEALLVKIGARIPDWRLESFFGLKCPKCSL